MRSRLSGRVVELRRGLWLLIVNLPPVHVSGQDAPKYPKTQRQVEAKGKRDAEAQLRAWIAELEQRSCKDPRRLTLAGMMDQWLGSSGLGLRDASHDFYQGIVDRHLKPAMGSRIAADLKRHDFTQYVTDRRAEGLSPPTLSHHIATVRRAYSWAIEEEILDANPLWHYRNKEARQERQKPVDVWDQDTISQAIVLARGRGVHPLAVLGGWCGLRPGEVCAIRWEDVLVSQRLLLVQRTVEELTGKLVEYSPKGGTMRLVPLTTAAIEELEQWRRFQDAKRIREPSWNPERRIMCRRDGAQLTPSGLASNWARFVRANGLPRLTPHGLRHSYGTYAFDTYGSKIAQKWLGHTDEHTTMIYHHETQDAMAAAIAAHEQATASGLAAAESAQNSRMIRGQVISLDARRSKNPCK